MIGRITYWNQIKGFGFVTYSEKKSEVEGYTHTQYFLHNSNFTKHENPVLGAFVVFQLGEPFELGRRAQAVGVRFATSEEIDAYKQTRKIKSGVTALAGGVL